MPTVLHTADGVRYSDTYPCLSHWMCQGGKATCTADVGWTLNGGKFGPTLFENRSRATVSARRDIRLSENAEYEILLNHDGRADSDGDAVLCVGPDGFGVQWVHEDLLRND
jgi:hypothetical protein